MPTKTVVLVDPSHLHRFDSRPRLGDYARQLWQRRHFIIANARSKAFQTGRDTFLGKAWLILDPLFQVAVYGIVFGLILKVSRGMDNFVGFLMIGVIFFGFLSKGINSGTRLVQRSRNLISAFKFPRAAVVFSETLRQLMDNILPAVVAIVVALAFQPGKLPTLAILCVIPLYLLIHLFTLGCAFWVARMTAFVPDLKSLVSLFTRALFFVSGVFFTIDRFDTSPTLQAIVEANPLYQFLMAVRTAVLDGQVPEASVWFYLALWSLVLAATGFVFFWRAEERYARVR